MTAMMLKNLQKMGITITRAILYHFHERTLILTQLKKILELTQKLKKIFRLGALRWVLELNFNKKIIASIFAIILTNVSVETYTIISVKLHRH